MKDKSSPRYAIDHEGLAATYPTIALGVVEFLTDAMARPGFRLERVCRGCESWDRGFRSRLESKPSMPGAVDPTTSCDGCFFGFLDPVGDLAEEHDRGHVEFLIEQIEQGIKTMSKGRDAGSQHRRIAEAKARLVELRQVIERYHAPKPRSRRTLVMELPIAKPTPLLSKPASSLVSDSNSTSI